MPQWTWKNPTSHGVHKSKTHQPRTPSYEWTPPVPEKPYSLRTAISSMSLSATQREPLPPYSSPTQSSINTEARRESLPDYNSSMTVRSNHCTNRHRHNSSSEWDSDSSSDEASSWSSSDVEDFFDNIYLERGPSSRRPSSGRSPQPKFPESPIEELPPVYGLSFPAVPATTEQLRIPEVNKLPSRPIHRVRSEAITLRKDISPSPGYAFTEERIIIKRHSPIPRRRYKSTVSSKHTKPSLDDYIEALRRELEILTLNHPSQIKLGQETRSIMLREATRQRKEAFVLRRRQDQPVQSDSTDGND